MSREQRRPAPPQRDATDASCEAALQADCEPGLLEWIEIAVRDLATLTEPPGNPQDPAGDPPDPSDSVRASDARGVDPLYGHGFALGEALGRRLRANCRRDPGPQGLALLVERLAAPPHADAPTHVARRGLLAGLCWELENALCDRTASEPLGLPRR